ncbi:DUF11 domain-containing protein [Candidatus Bathyarchaeota archaeon]|nr:DUF11 domain-containing protein [Candidatus Bathyarchaeota archaeon]
MRKTIAFLLGFTLVLGLGLAVLHPSLQLIGLWLSPALGSQFYVALSLAYLLLADPLRYTAVLAVWLGVAFIGGVIIRRRLGGVLTMLLVWLLVVPMLALSVFGVAMNVQSIMTEYEGEEALGLVPSIPEGMTLTRLMETPILGDIFSDVLEMINEDIGEEIGMEIVMGYAYRAATWVALKPILVIVGALLGVEAGKLGARYAPSVLPRSLNMGATPVNALKTLFIVFMMIGASAAPAVGQFIDFGDTVYLEQVLAGTDGQGHIGLVNLFIETADAVDLDDNVVATVIISHRIEAANLLTLLPVPQELDTESFLNIAPSILFAVVYMDTSPEDAMLNAEQVKTQMEERYGVELTSLQAVMLPEMQLNEATLPPMTVVICYSEASAEGLASTFLGEFEEHGGLADAVEAAVANGLLTPNAKEGSSDASLFITGVVRLEPFRVLLPDDPIIQLYSQYAEIFFEEPLGFAASAHYWDQGATGSAQGQTVDLAELLGLASLPSYSGGSDASFVTFMTPNKTASWDELVPNIKVSSNLPGNSVLLQVYGFLVGELGVIEIEEGTAITADTLRVSLGDSLPSKLSVTKTVNRERAGVGSGVTVTVSVKNEGDHAVSDVIIDDGSTRLGFLNALETSGATVKTLQSLAPGATETLTYDVALKRPGFFFLRPASVSYMSGGQTVYTVSDRPTVEMGPPTVVYAGLTMRGDLVHFIDLMTGGNGETFVTVGVLIVCALIAVNLYLSVRRWRQPAAGSLEAATLDEAQSEP